MSIQDLELLCQNVDVTIDEVKQLVEKLQMKGKLNIDLSPHILRIIYIFTNVDIIKYMHSATNLPNWIKYTIEMYFSMVMRMIIHRNSCIEAAICKCMLWNLQQMIENIDIDIPKFGDKLQNIVIRWCFTQYIGIPIKQKQTRFHKLRYLYMILSILR